MSDDVLSQHEDRVADALVDIINYAGRVLISAGPGSAYQADKATELRVRVDRLIGLLDGDGGSIPHTRADAVQAAVARDARRYTLGQILIDAGHLGGAA